MDTLLNSSPKAALIKIVVGAVFACIIGYAVIAEHDANELIDELYPKKDKKKISI